MSAALDTSGEVVCRTTPNRLEAVTWDDLLPLTRGFTGAALADLNVYLSGFPGRGRQTVGFADLAPETLRRFMKDCETFPTEGERASASAEERGAWFWKDRQRNQYPGFFPPLTLVLRDGLVRIEEGGR
jgi:hypothetical protein